MNIVILTKTWESGRSLAAMLSKTAAKAVVVCDIADADCAAEKTNARCVFFEREFAEDYASFFAQFKNDSIYFVPISKRNDNKDIIRAINTGRTVYYLKAPVSRADLETAIKCLRLWLQ